jgi:(1->4)-alpha-D-glucan 1-alpha-D-glucosylmutase
MNSLTQTVLKCTLPGVPDFYQGTEIWDFSLVDPDNRRPVDYPWRERLLDSLAAATPADLKDQWKTGQIKLFVIQRLLGYRRQHALLFQNGDYHEVAAEGKQADRIIAFERRWKEARLLVIVPRITCDLGFFPVGDSWIETSVTLHESAPTGWLNILTNKTVAAGGVLALSAVLSDFPFAVLRQIDA